MTRINAGYPPKQLSRQHLIAEHREIVRIPNTIKSGKAKVRDIPDTFRLGSGHVKFFYDKLKFLHHRYLSIYEECKSRGYNITWFGDAFHDIPTELYNDYIPTEEAVSLITQRIKERTKNG